MLEMFNFSSVTDSRFRKPSWCDFMSASKFVATRDFEIPRCSIAIALAIPTSGSASIAAPSGVLASGGPKAQVKLMRDLPLKGLLPPISVLRLFRFIPPRPVHHQMGHHHQREQVVDMLFNLRKMDGWLTEEDVYKIKHLKSAVVTRLPNDATSCREWRAAFLASISRIDLSKTDVLVKWATHAMEGRGKVMRMLPRDCVAHPLAS